jgi:hypothetical protein
MIQCSQLLWSKGSLAFFISFALGGYQDSWCHRKFKSAILDPMRFNVYTPPVSKYLSVIIFFIILTIHLILKIMQVTSILFARCFSIVGILSSTYLLHICNNFSG